ncbi:hypothetical protein [Terracoccus sp. 273MFTsu3.1]|uniref:hypothetical protein n=1 Tax=Terracoccus sp. 273MFTsu3.1 TaxID=1172188 RepID=UPI0003688261|nr:hypothetical protein [Terracoccus sp. 273MFTsu3.1]
MARQQVDDQALGAGIATRDLPDASSSAAGSIALTGRWWLWPLAIYLVTRALNAVMIVVAGRSSITLEEFVGSGHKHFGTFAGTAPPGYLTSVTRWDGQWYWEIAAHGYPSVLPTDANGNVEQNPWAFFPLYPYLVRGVMFVTRLDFPVSATLVSLTCGAAAMLVLYRVVQPRYGHLGGTLAVLGMTTFVCAPVFQMAYAEGLALLLLLISLWSVLARRYVLAAIVLLLLAFTRGVTAPLAPALLLYGALMWRRGRIRRKDAVALVLLATWAGLLAFAWFVTAGVVTGRWNTYVLTQKAWNPELTVIPVVRFIARNSDVAGGQIGASVIAIAWAALLIWFLTKGQKEPLLALWTGMYVAYLLAVTDWNWSNVRYYLLALPVLWPLVAPFRGERSARPRVLVACVVAAVSLAMQWWYIRYCVTISPELVQVP